VEDKVIGWKGVGLICVDYKRDESPFALKTVMNILVPENVQKFFTGRGIVSFLRRTLIHGVRQLITYSKISTK
jgi:hypothetical protein